MRAGHRDRLIVSLDYGSQPVFALKEAAHGLCDVIWLVDLSQPETAHMARLMRRIGTVVDISDRSEQPLVETLEACAPTGLLNLNDRDLVLLAGVANKLGLPFHAPATARALSDKYEQRRALRAAGLPTPDFEAVAAEAGPVDLGRLAGQVGFPAVLKPRRGTGSRNTYRVGGRAEFSHLVAAPGLRQEEPDGLILEGFLAGPDRTVSRFDPIVSVETFVRAGTIHHFAVTGRLPFAEPFRETGLVLPSDLSPEDTDAATRTAAAAITALGVAHGCLHTEVKFTPEGPRVIEVNGRLGGGIPQLVTLAGGNRSILRAAMELALGRPTPIDLPIEYSRIGWERTVTPPVTADRVGDIGGLHSLRDLPGIEQVTINRSPGDEVDWRHGLGDFVFQVYGSAHSYDEVESRCERVDGAVTITYDRHSASHSTPPLA